MKSSFHIAVRAVCCAYLVLLCACSVREDTEDCVQYALNVRAVDTDGNDITDNGVLEKTDLYLFDESGFVRMVPSGSSSDYLFGTSKAQTLTLVAWGNVKQDTLVTVDIAPGTSLEQANLQLRKRTAGDNLTVTDLFYSRTTLTREGVAMQKTRGVQEETVTLVMERLVACMSIRTRYLAQRYPFTGEPYSFIVRGTGNTVNFLGEVTGEDVGYRPESETDDKGDVYAPPFKLFPTVEGQCMEIDIYRKERKICTITKDNDGKPICAPVGKQVEVDIDFRYADVKVTVTIVPWGEVRQDTEM